MFKEKIGLKLKLEKYKYREVFKPKFERKIHF